MRIKKLAISLTASALLLSGCTTAHKHPGIVGMPATGSDVYTAGIGYDSSYGGGSTSCICRPAPASSSYYFELNSFDVHPADMGCIKAEARYLVAHPGTKVRVEGNCDNRGSREYNRALGWKRANAVKAVLLQEGVSPSQITTFSWGSEKASPGTGEAVWGKDRRVDVMFR